MKINEKNLCMFATSPPVDLEGYLLKRGEVNKSYQKRYFVLKGNLLFYFERKTDREPLGVIILEGCTIELAEDGEQYCFQIIFHGMNNRTYLLSAESQELMEQWMKALTCAGYEYMKLMVSELQRQLGEIEGTKVETPESTPAAAPKPPPRRHNPFNRQAPAIPTVNNNSNNNNTNNNNNNNINNDHSKNSKNINNTINEIINDTNLLSTTALSNKKTVEKSSSTSTIIPATTTESIKTYHNNNNNNISNTKQKTQAKRESGPPMESHF